MKKKELYLDILALNLDDFITKYKIARENIVSNAGYEKMKELTRIHQPETIPGYFYFSGNDLRLIYIADNDLPQQLWNEFMESVPDPAGTTVRSRAGKNINHIIFAEKGFAGSLDNGIVKFIEIFTPLSLEEYLSTIYREPPQFRK